RDNASPMRRSDDPLGSVVVGDVMQRSVEKVRDSQSIERVANRLAAADAHAAAVMDERDMLVGVVTASDIARSADEDPARPVSEIMRRQIVIARPSQRVADALAQPGAQDLRQLLVVEGTRGERRPVGLLRRSDVVAAYLRARDREARIIRRARTIDEQSAGAETVEIIVRAGMAGAGRTLIQLGLPADVVITRIIRDGVVIIPRGSVRVETGDRVQVLGAADVLPLVLRRFEKGDGAGPTDGESGIPAGDGEASERT
ncbi:MAG: CBS domain-containing protein, partial [Gemmatimonadaceae bacterium]